jgi:hypothetical protein
MSDTIRVEVSSLAATYLTELLDYRTITLRSPARNDDGSDGHLDTIRNADRRLRDLEARLYAEWPRKDGETAVEQLADWVRYMVRKAQGKDKMPA